MTRVAKSVEFESAHRLSHHPGKCNRIHGHNYKVEGAVILTLDSTMLEIGRPLDFSDLKGILTGIVEEWDHRLLLNANDSLLPALMDCIGESIVTFPGDPTAENMAQYIATELLLKTASSLSPNLIAVEVTVWETGDSCATYKVET